MSGPADLLSAPAGQGSESLAPRRTIRDQIRSILRARILRQDLMPGERLNESSLAEEFGVSRGPVREALGSLAHEGFLRSEPGRGHFVTELSPSELRELFVILATLETLAVSESGPFGPEAIGRLEGLNEAMADTVAIPEDAPAANLRWHEALVAGCRNGLLVELLRSLWMQAYRYEFAFFADPRHISDSVEFHGEVIEALRGGESGAIEEAIRRHWLTDLGFLEGRLGEVDGAAGSPGAEEGS